VPALLLLAVWCPRWLCFCEFALRRPRGHRIGLELRLPALGGLELSHLLWTRIGSEMLVHNTRYNTVLLYQTQQVNLALQHTARLIIPYSDTCSCHYRFIVNLVTLHLTSGV
jgi:hypothetical protein